MIRTLPVATLSLFATLGARAQEPTLQDPVAEAWVAFRAEQGPDWTSVWNKFTGTPKAIYGQGLRVSEQPVKSLDAARALAQRVLDDHSALLGKGNSTFVEIIGADTARVFVFVYDQHYRGFEVVGGRADLRLHKNGVVSMFGSEAVPIPANFELMPKLDGEVAWAFAQQEMKAKEGALDVDLVIWADTDGPALATPYLAWRAQVDDRSGERPIVGKVYVDALTGRILATVDEVYSCTEGHTHIKGEPGSHDHGEGAAAAPALVDITGNVKSWMNRGVSPLSALTNQPLQGVRVSAAGGGSAFTDVNGDFTIPYAGTAPVNLTVNFSSGNGERVGQVVAAQGTALTTTVSATPGVPAQIQLLSAAANVFDWSQATAFWHVDDVNRWITSLTGPIPNNRQSVRATVNIASTCNAYYTNNSINFYAAGGNCNMTGFSSVIYHEWGHGCDDAFGGISQTDGLSEGWGDILSCYRLNDPVVGRDFTTSGGIVRTALNTLRYPAGGGVHQQGQTWMGWAWQVREGLKASLGAALGTQVAEQIVVASIVADATNQPDAVREVFILDDNDGNLNNGTPNYGVLEAAALLRSLPYPQIQLGSITHTPLTNTTDQLEPQLVSANVVPISGSFSAVRVVYNAGSGSQTRSMVNAGGTNYRALLPGLLAPAAVTYHIEAVHSTGPVLRLPTSGEFGYAVGNQVIFFADNFDGPNLGWTHGQIATQDDWQLGTPAGRSGTSSGVAWSDPGTAWSGARIWANDLGNSGFNGAYAANVNNWLRSPVLNLTGRTGVTLGFKRWLTVEEGIYDQAEIVVNGIVVWSNPANGHLVDTGWVDFQLPIPQADNNPGVTLEWRLRTDAGLQLGGWNIDDVTLFASGSLPPPPLTVELSPPQVTLGGNTTLTMDGLPNALAVLLLSDTQGPTNIPGLPELHVGSNFLALNAGLDGSGNLTANLTIGVHPSAQGVVYYLHGLQWTGSVFEASNKCLLLMGN